jgi:hypothetical protein
MAMRTFWTGWEREFGGQGFDRLDEVHFCIGINIEKAMTSKPKVMTKGAKLILRAIFRRRWMVDKPRMKEVARAMRLKELRLK